MTDRILLFIAVLMGLLASRSVHGMDCGSRLAHELLKDRDYARAPFFYDRFGGLFLNAVGVGGPLPGHLDGLAFFANNRQFVTGAIVSRLSMQPVAITIRYFLPDDPHSVVIKNIVILPDEDTPALRAYLHKVIRSWTYPQSSLRFDIPTDPDELARPILVPATNLAMHHLLVEAGLKKTGVISEFFSQCDAYVFRLPTP